MPLVDAKRHRIHRFAAVQRVIGVLLMIFSVTMLPPVLVVIAMQRLFVKGLVETEK